MIILILRVLRVAPTVGIIVGGYKSIISNNRIAKIHVERKALYDAVRRAYLITSEQNRFPVILDIKYDKMIVY